KIGDEQTQRRTDAGVIEDLRVAQRAGGDARDLLARVDGGRVGREQREIGGARLDDTLARDERAQLGDGDARVRLERQLAGRRQGQGFVAAGGRAEKSG